MHGMTEENEEMQAVEGSHGNESWANTLGLFML